LWLLIFLLFYLLLQIYVYKTVFMKNWIALSPLFDEINLSESSSSQTSYHFKIIDCFLTNPVDFILSFCLFSSE
jgi:hypothetical protein